MSLDCVKSYVKTDISSVRWSISVVCVEEPTMKNNNTKPTYPIVKPGNVIPASGGLVEYKDGNGTKRMLLVRVFQKPIDATK
jgi:hypothetical protein